MSSIVTRTGDDGTTGLMYDRRVPKTHPQVEAYGTVDELSACLSQASALTGDAWLKQEIYLIQQNLVALMAELALAEEDWERYAQSKYAKMEPGMVDRLDALAAELEKGGITFQDWNLVGFSPGGASLDLARTICRRAERRVWILSDSFHQKKPLIARYLNRLADVLWLLARRHFPGSAALPI